MGGDADARFALRRADARDLDAIREVWLAAELAESGAAPVRRPAPSCFRHEIETGEVWLAERAGRAIGFGSALPRAGFVYLAELFVHPEAQSAGVGRALLDRLAPRDGRAFCTFASRDPRAHALYARAGMRPLTPRYTLAAPAGALAIATAGDIAAVRAQADDPEFRRMHAEIGGLFDDRDHDHWLSARAAAPLWLVRDGARIGCGYVQMRDDESFWHPDAVTVGPAGALDAADAAACALALLAWAQTRGERVQIALCGPHPALGAAIAAGMRIEYVEMVFTSGPRLCADFERYLI